MKSVFVYCEITEEGNVAEVSLELLSKGRKLANELSTNLEAVVIGFKLDGIPAHIIPYGVDVVHLADHAELFPYRTLPHAAVVIDLFSREQPEVSLFGATSVGRDLAPRVSSAMQCGLTADCTSLEIGDHFENKTQREFKNLLYQIRPAFGGNIIATIINPETRPQMATVREGVMKQEIVDINYSGVIKNIDLTTILKDEYFAVKILERHIEQSKINIKGAQVVVAGGYGVGSPENFRLLFELAEALGGEVGATRAAVDAGYIEHERQIGQTGITVRPKLYIACGISGAVQHRAGMDQSAKIISINIDPKAPINAIADYTIIGSVSEIVPKMIRYYKANSK